MPRRSGEAGESANHYTYRAEWSPEWGQYQGFCVEFPGLSRQAPTPGEAIALVEQWVNEMVASGEPVPTPLTERNYSGNFMVRTSRALHARLTIEAAEQGVSVNQWVVQKLVGPRPSTDDW